MVNPDNNKNAKELTINKNNKNYWERTRYLFRSYEKWAGKESVDLDSLSYEDAINFVNYLVLHKRKTIKPKSWGLYRFAVRACLIHEDVADILAVRSFVKNKEIKSQTTSKRSNILTSRMLKELTDLLETSNSKYKDISINWMQSSLLTGLRPSEWLNASICYIDAEPFLKVRNLRKGISSKETLSEHRYIPIFHLDNHDQDVITKNINLLKIISTSNAYENYYSGCRQLIQLYTQKIFGATSSISLYSGRQQFAANLKASGVPQDTIMKVMGHANTKTQRHHYSKKSNGEQIAFPIQAADKANEQN